MITLEEQAGTSAGLDTSISFDGTHRDGIHASAIARDAIFAMLPAAHPLALAEVISTTNLACSSLILLSSDSDWGAESQVDKFVDTLGRPHVVFRTSSLGTMLTLVALGHGIGLVGSAQATGVKRGSVVLRTVGRVTPPLTFWNLMNRARRGLSLWMRTTERRNEP